MLRKPPISSLCLVLAVVAFTSSAQAVNAKEAGFRDLVLFKDHNFVLPSGGIVAREETLRNDPSMVEKFVRASVMGFLFSRNNRAESIKILERNLKIDEPTARTIYDSSRPTMTVDGGLSPETQKRMIAFFTKIAPSKDVTAADKVFDFSFLRRAHSTLQAQRWKPAS